MLDNRDQFETRNILKNSIAFFIKLFLFSSCDTFNFQDQYLKKIDEFLLHIVEGITSDLITSQQTSTADILRHIFTSK